MPIWLLLFEIGIKVCSVTTQHNIMRHNKGQLVNLKAVLNKWLIHITLQFVHSTAMTWKTLK